MRKIFTKLPFAVLALAISSGTMYANLLNISSTALSLTCSTATGPGTLGTIAVKSIGTLSGVTTISVVPTAASLALTGITISGGTQTLSASVTTVNYTVVAAQGCAGLVSGSNSKSIQFNANNVADASQTETVTVTATTPMTVTPTATVICAKYGSVYSSGPGQPISVTSVNANGTPFTVDALNARPAWLNVAPTSGVANGSATTFTLTASNTCGAFADQSTFTLPVTSPPALPSNVVVTLSVVNLAITATGPASGLTCSTTTGVSTSGSVVIAPVAPLTGSNTIAVTAPGVTGLVITPVGGTTLSSSVSSLSFTVTAAAGCAGLSNGANANIPLQFGANGVGTASTSTSVTVDAGSSSLAVTPTAITVICARTGSLGSYVYTAGALQTSYVTSAVSGGVAFTGSLTGKPAWLAVAGNAGTANASPSAITFTPVCSGTPTNNATFVLPLAAPAPAPVVNVTVTLSVVTTTLVATPSATLTCNTLTGTGAPGSIIISPAIALTGQNTLVVAPPVANPSGLVITAPANQTLSASVPSITYSVTAAPGCRGLISGSSNSVNATFTAAGQADVQVATPVTVTVASTSALQVSPSSVTVTCGRSGPSSAYVYTAGPAQTISVTSQATGGTPFTFGSQSPAGSLTLVGTAGTASLNANTFTVKDICSSSTVDRTRITVPLKAVAPATADANLTVTISLVGPSGLSFLPAAPSLTYVKGSGTAGKADVTIYSAPARVYSVDTPTLPIWLTVDSISGSANTQGTNLRFSSTSICDTMAPGSYSATVWLKVSGYAETPIPVSLLITNTAGQLSIVEGFSRSINWTFGQAPPSGYFVTPISTDSAIPYNVTTTGIVSLVDSNNNPITHGVAYNFKSPLAVAFSDFSSAQPGQVLTGAITFTWGPASTQTVFTFNVTVLSPGATLSAISPGTVPTASSGTPVTLALYGTGFVVSTDPRQMTTVGIVTQGGFVIDPAISSVTVYSTTSMAVTITVPNSDPYLPFSPTGSGGNVTLGVCNPLGTSCLTPTGTASFSIGNNPIVQVVTSASSFLQPAVASPTTLAPFDMISIFGSNFCGAACTSSTILYGAVDPTTQAYTPYLNTPGDPANSQRQVVVTFWTHPTDSSSPVSLGAAPLLFATNSQINLLVPDSVATANTATVDIVTTFGTSASKVTSQPFNVTITATNPGMFTVGQDGQGQGAILGTDWNLVTLGHEAAVRNSASDSDIVHLYLTGLGEPDSTATDSTPALSGAMYSRTCLSLATYNTDAGALSSDDGIIIQGSAIASNRLQPCLTVAPTVNIGGVPATVTYAGWVADSVAGLYQIDARLPISTSAFATVPGGTTATITGPTLLPVVVIANSVSSQPGVTIAVAPRLKVAAPDTLSGTVGTLWDTTAAAQVQASDGTPSYTTYHYAVTSGSLPGGILLNANTGYLYGTPLANTNGGYVVTVTVSDSATPPLTGSVTFSLQVNGGLVLSNSGLSAVTYGTGGPVTTVQATGGVWGYTYSAVSGPITVNSSTGVVSVAPTVLAGTYPVSVQASDTNGYIGTLQFSVVVNLQVVDQGPDSATAASPGVITQLATYGATGSLHYALSAGSATSYGTYVSVNDAGTVSIYGTPVQTSGTPISITINVTDLSAPSGATSGVGTKTISLTIN